MSLWTALTTNHVVTDSDSMDPRLVGRTYAIPFGAVWDNAVRLAAGGLRGWKMIRWDDQEGVLEAEVEGVVFSLLATVTLRIGLDENGQTRVDMEARTVSSRGDLGANARRTERFFLTLDKALGADASTILAAA